MKRSIMAVLMLVVVALPIGCHCCDGDGVAYTREERKEIHRRVREMDCRQLVDDLDYLFLREQPTRLSRWAIE